MMSDAKEQLARLSAEQQEELRASLLRLNRQRQPKRFACSFAQQRLWVLEQMAGATSAYNVPTALRLRGSLAVDVLERCFGEVIRRHGSLRTTFKAKPETGIPEQIVNPWSPFRLQVEDLCDYAGTPRLELARSIANEEAQRPFDLATGPLLRARLLKLAQDDHVLLLTLHHIVTDMWSTEVLTRELITLYKAFSQNQPSPLAELPIQYADFAHWQRQRLSGETLERQLAYWRDQLAGHLPVLELPTRGPRATQHSLNGAELQWTIDSQLTARLKQLSRGEGATLFMTLLSAFMVLLFRYTGQTDLLVGTPIANRNRTEIEGLIGLLINTLVLRCELAGEPSFRQLLGRVKEAALAAYAHQEVPFEKLVEELQPERDLRRTPLFQAMFAMQNVPRQDTRAFDLSITPFELEVRSAKFEMTLTVLEDEQKLRTAWEYNTDLFDSSMIERMMGHFETLLSSLVANPDERISRLPILTSSERAALLAPHRSGTFETIHAESIQELFEAQVARGPDAVALAYEDRRLTYKELNRRVNQLAHHLRSLRVGPESLVGMAMERSIEMVVGLLAILKAGGAYVPLDPAYPPDRLGFVLNDAGIRALITQTSLLTRLPDHQAKVIRLDSDWGQAQVRREENPEDRAGPDNLAYVIYTSGSTGRPKGALVTHSHVMRLFAATESWFGFQPQDVWTLFHSCAFDFSVWEIWGALLYGGRLVVTPYLVSRSPQSFYQLLGREQVTVLNWHSPLVFRFCRYSSSRWCRLHRCGTRL